MINIGSHVKITPKMHRGYPWEHDTLIVVGRRSYNTERFVLESIPSGKYPILFKDFSYYAYWLDEINLIIEND